MPSTVIVEPDTLVTFPKAPNTLVVLNRAGTVPVVRGKPPPGLPRKPPPPPGPPRSTQLPLTAAVTVTRVASTLPPVPLVPVAEMHVPTVMSRRSRGTVAVMAVLVVRSTVVCPLVPWTSRSWPRMLAMVPEAAGAKLGAPVGAVVVVLLAAANGPLAMSDTATRVPTTRAGRRAWFSRRTVLSICVSSSCCIRDGSIAAQGLYGRQAGGTGRGVNPENDSDHDGHDDGADGGRKGNGDLVGYEMR